MKPLQSLSNSYTTPDGSVTFYILPFRNVQSEAVRLELRRLEPPAKYVNSVTGEQTYDEPAEFKRDADRARVMNSPVVSKWGFRWLWTGMHTNFYQAEALTTAIEFNTPPVSSEAKALQTYWQNRPTDVRERWELYKSLISIDVCNLWAQAELACRDHTMDAPAPLQNAPVTEQEKKVKSKRKATSSPRSAPASSPNSTAK